MSEKFCECPKCGETDITATEINMEGELMWETITCAKCFFEWNEVYKFWRCELPGTCEELDEAGKPIPGTGIWD